MNSGLNVHERDLLGRVRSNPDLLALFFKKVRGIKWFDPLRNEGYFDPSNLPKPAPSNQEGYVTIPRWAVTEYLTKTAKELSTPGAREFAPKFIELMTGCTAYARQEGFSNYQTWWKFSQILQDIPLEFVPLEFSETIDYWLDDPFDRSLIATEIGEKWAPRLLESDSAHALDLSAEAIRILFKVVPIARNAGGVERKDAALRLDSRSAEKITASVANLSGRRLGVRIISEFRSMLRAALEIKGNDSWSSIWQPSIEEHAQNKHHDQAENVLVKALRDSVDGYLTSNPSESDNLVRDLLLPDIQTIERIGIYALTNYFDIRMKSVDVVLDKKFFSSKYRHETWHLLNRCYGRLQTTQRDRVLVIIASRERRTEDGNVLLEASAYERAIWLSAIKDFGDEELRLYRLAVDQAKAEPEHPDFASYSTSGWVEAKSPYTAEELASFEIPELVEVLASFKGDGGWNSPNREGLSRTFKAVLKSAPSRFAPELGVFSRLDPTYLHATIDSFAELWAEKASLPWDDIWPCLVSFCESIVGENRPPSVNLAVEKSDDSPDNKWVVSSMARLFESGLKADEHSFHASLNKRVESLLTTLLVGQPGADFALGCDAVSIAINSARGNCLEALINLTLRECRIADRHSGGHEEIWKRFQAYYDREIDDADTYEFPTLVTNYLPNFRYLSCAWLLEKLPQIFDQNNQLRWHCAMQGYSYNPIVYDEVYKYLKDSGDFLKGLQDETLKDEVEKKIVQNIAVAYLQGLESVSADDSLMRALIERQEFDELSQLVWFIWSQRRTGDAAQREKVHVLWKLLSDRLNLSSSEGKRLASSLTHWAAFIETLDGERQRLLLEIAPFADVAHNSAEFLRELARLSGSYALEVQKVWIRMLEGTTPTYPEEDMKQILSNIYAAGDEGRRAAHSVVGEYLKRGDEVLNAWLRELQARELRSLRQSDASSGNTER